MRLQTKARCLSIHLHIIRCLHFVLLYVFTPPAALVSRQYMDMSRIRIEGLLAAFPRLLGSGRQHTYVETDSVRYVYQPLEVSRPRHDASRVNAVLRPFLSSQLMSCDLGLRSVQSCLHCAIVPHPITSDR